MSRWRQHLKNMFARSARTRTDKTARAKPAARPEAPMSPPDQPETDMYASFRRDIMPLLDILKNMPADDAGMEFFTRADVICADKAQRPEDKRIDVWLFHTHETTPANKLHQEPNSYLISMESKRSTPEKPDYSQLLALSKTPVLRLCVRPQETGEARITSHTYTERYEKPQAGKNYSIYSGDYGMVHENSEKTPHARVADFAAAIDVWLESHAPAQKQNLQNILNPKTAIDLLPPLNIRKRQP